MSLYDVISVLSVLSGRLLATVNFGGELVLVWWHDRVRGWMYDWLL